MSACTASPNSADPSEPINFTDQLQCASPVATISTGMSIGTEACAPNEIWRVVSPARPRSSKRSAISASPATSVVLCTTARRIKFVAEIGKGGSGRFDHDRLVDFESGLRRPELALLRDRDRDHAIACQAVGRDKLRVDAALRVGPEGCIPKRTGEEVLAQAVQERRSTFAVADEVAFVREIRFRQIFPQERRQASGWWKHRARAVD